MIDMGSIASLAGSLKAMGDIAKAMVDQGSALAAQTHHAAMVEEVRQLKARIAELEAWDRQKERHQLTDHSGGTFAYALKAGMEAGEPFHRICAHCYEQRRKSILQSHGFFQGGREKVSCPACETRFMLGVSRGYGQVRTRNDWDPFTGR